MWLVREPAIDLRRMSNHVFVTGGRRSQRIESNISFTRGVCIESSERSLLCLQGAAPNG